MNLHTITKDAKEELRERLDDDPEMTYPEDVVSEIADGAVPIYTADLMDLAANNIDLAVMEPECGPAFDGSPTPTNIVAANVYELVSNALYQELETWKEEQEEED